MIRDNSNNQYGNDLYVINNFLDQQRELTAVERFSEQHDTGDPDQSKYYRDLIPLSRPEKGQQYAFEVDLDACSGCKACVAACHNLNGLDETESWRDVGLLTGGDEEKPIHQHVTTACHHCLEPACMDGCPVNAYEKNPDTGIVKHLDDQCIGCQYCVLKCPYDVPKYNAKKGIVRKCDMCSDRLAVGEAPACVQSCPNDAIKIKVVDVEGVEALADRNEFVAGAPSPGYTKPTTVYHSTNPQLSESVPADLYSVKPQHAHWSLIFMLVLTQMAVGALLIEQLMYFLLQGSGQKALSPVHATSALLLGVTAIVAATFHLGRPFYAFRAVIGLRTSWLSREIIAFGGFAKATAVYAAITWFFPDASLYRMIAGGSAVVFGLFGIFCSAMLYHDTQRVFWKLPATSAKFFITMFTLGIPLSLLTLLILSKVSDGLAVGDVMSQWGYPFIGFMLVAAIAKLLIEAKIFTHLSQESFTPLKRTATLMTSQLVTVTLRRFAFGVFGGVVIPVLLLLEPIVAKDSYTTPFLFVMVGLMFVLNVLGELSERYLFFSAVVSPKMPGGVI